MLTIDHLGIAVKSLAAAKSIYEKLGLTVSPEETNSRSLLGTINDFTNLLEWELDQNPKADLLHLSLKLSESPVKPLGYRNPAVITAEIFKT